jgi:hypothetical protein
MLALLSLAKLRSGFITKTNVAEPFGGEAWRRGVLLLFRVVQRPVSI